MANQQDAPLNAPSGNQINIRNDISDGEKHYTEQRNKKIQGCLLKHGIDCKLNEVPRIAVLGSGGGERAEVAMLGILRQLAEENLLDSVMYLSGVSGSTWSMSTLYKDPTWSAPDKVKALIDRELSKLSKETTVTFSDSVKWLRSRDLDGDLSLTDIWAVIVACLYLKEMNTHILSDQAGRDATNPYPTYSSMERECFQRRSAQDGWFEMGPHECGFSGLGAFVETSLLKSPFDNGQLIMHSKQMDMLQLQGICGSCFADGKTNIEAMMDILLPFLFNLIWLWLKLSYGGWFFGKSEGVSDEVTDITMTVVQLLDSSKETKDSLEAIAHLKSLLGDKCKDSSLTLWMMDSETWMSKNEMEREQLARKISHEMIFSSDCWTKDQKQHLGMEYSDYWWVTTRILPYIALATSAVGLYFVWEWGTMANFLYNMKLPEIPEVMTAANQMHLIDAGLQLNSPYPPILRPERDVDLIISFDFSAGDPFQTIHDASKYASQINKPFPKVDVPNTPYPKSFYAFERKEITVVHVPLFNMDNCKDIKGIDKERKEYPTMNLPLNDEKKIQHLADLAAKNVKINREKILSQIKMKAHERKKPML